MKCLILCLLSFSLLRGIVCAQLKENNFLIVDTLNENIHTSKITGNGTKFLHLKNTSFRYEKDLTFIYSINYGTNYCCNYYEVKEIPKEWNIITVKDVVAHMEDKSTGFRFNKKKLFFVEYDQERRIYKAYQVDIIGWPRTD